ncbi:MAG: hypothetical protein ABI632_04495 [Pseudolysinimonas sp.]
MPAATTPALAPAKSAVAEGLPKPIPQHARVELGYETDANGSIPKGLESRQFAAASQFVLAIQVDDLAAGVAVTAHWLDAQGAVVGSQTLATRGGERFLDFHTPDTSRWPPGAYRVEVRTGDAAPVTVDFRVERAGGSGA